MLLFAGFIYIYKKFVYKKLAKGLATIKKGTRLKKNLEAVKFPFLKIESKGFGKKQHALDVVCMCFL